MPNFDPIPSGSRSAPGADAPPNGSTSFGYPSSVPAWARPVSATSLKSQKTASSATSRSASPALDDQANGQDLHQEQGPILALSAGCQPDEVYRVTLPAWRYTLRKWLVHSLEGETRILARMQVRPAPWQLGTAERPNGLDLIPLRIHRKRPARSSGTRTSSGAQYSGLSELRKPCASEPIDPAESTLSRAQTLRSSAFMICLPMFFWFGHYEQGLA